jgi:hypothetical protein
MSDPCPIAPNDDVLGVGVRINFYATMVLLAVIPRSPYTEELLNVLFANTGIAGLALLITAIEQTAKNQLSLFHAIFVQHILFFLGTGAAPVGKYIWTKSRIVMGVIIQFASVLAFTVWALYLWVHAKNFGPQNQCNNEVKYVLMFKTVNATASWLRVLWITTLIASALGLMITFGYNGFILYVMRNEENTEESEKGWYFSMSFAQILVAIYATVMLELAVRRNSTLHGGIVTISPVSASSSWAFGQILAIMMLFSNLNEVIHCLFGYIARRRKRSHERRTEEAQQASGDTDVPLESAPYRPRGRPGSHLSTRDASQMNLSSEHELLNLKDKENSHVSEVTVGEIRDQPVGTLR